MTVSVAVIGMIEIDMLIVVGTGTESKNMMMNGTGEDHRGHMPNHGYHMKTTHGQDQRMQIMKRGAV